MRQHLHVSSAAGLLLCALGSGCSEEPAGPEPAAGEEVGVVLTSVDRALTIFPVDAPDEAFPIGIAPDGSPVTIAVREGLVAVPLGIVPAVAVVDIAARSVVRTVPLPDGSGATGIAFLNDSIAIAANPNRNTVSPINVRRGTRGDEIEVGSYPQAAVSVNDTVYVVNANLGPDFLPAGPSTLSVIADVPARVVRTIELSGMNAGAAAATPDGQLVVIHSGTFGGANGSLSIVSRATLEEVEHIAGFGEFPGGVAVSPAGRVHVTSFSYGLAVWDPASDQFLRAPADAVTPDGIPAVSGIAFDEDGRLYTLVPECTQPGRALRLTATFEIAAEIAMGICPLAIAFGRVP